MAPSASKAAGGTRTTSRVIISSPPTARTAGIGCFANGAAPGNGFCMATSPDGAPAYAELHCLTNFSFLRGASHPEDLVLLAANKAGYGNLSQLITRARRAADKGSYRLCCDDLREDIDDCLALLLPNAETDLVQTRWLARRFAGRCWLAVELLRGADDLRDLQARRARAAELSVPLVASGDVHIHARGRRALQDTLTAIRLGCTVAEAGVQLFQHGERHLRPRARLARIYPAELLAESVRIAV